MAVQELLTVLRDRTDNEVNQSDVTNIATKRKRSQKR